MALLLPLLCCCSWPPCNKYAKTSVHRNAFSILLQVQYDKKKKSTVWAFFKHRQKKHHSMRLGGCCLMTIDGICWWSNCSPFHPGDEQRGVTHHEGILFYLYLFIVVLFNLILFYHSHGYSTSKLKKHEHTKWEVCHVLSQLTSLKKHKMSQQQKPKKHKEALIRPNC